jgi:hypothetical protein
MPAQLTTQNATITTATIEVKALTIGAKQVTLAVFRQLQEETVIRPLNAKLVSEELWGTVNYHPDRCADEPEHLHVVWQKGVELRRARVTAPGHAAYRHLYAGLHAEALIANGLRSTSKRAKPGHPDRVQIVGGTSTTGFARFTHRGVLFHGPVRGEFISTFYGQGALSTDERWERIRYIAGPHATAETIADELPAYAYTEAWRQIQALPQLFIAV